MSPSPHFAPLTVRRESDRLLEQRHGGGQRHKGQRDRGGEPDRLLPRQGGAAAGRMGEERGYSEHEGQRHGRDRQRRQGSGPPPAFPKRPEALGGEEGGRNRIGGGG